MDISTIQQLIQLQAMSQLAQSSRPTYDQTSASTNNFSNLFTQSLNQSSQSSPLINQSLGLLNGLTNGETNPLSLLSSILGNIQPNNVQQNQFTNSPTSLFHNYVNTYDNNAKKTNTTALTDTAKTDTGKKTDYDAIIKKASELHGIPEKMIKAVIQQESGFNPNVKSYAGAAGLMQLMPGTARYLGVTDVYNPEQNILAGTKYLKQMLTKFGDYSTMLAAYNAGPGNVAKYGGIPPFNETQNYVRKIMNSYNA